MLDPDQDSMNPDFRNTGIFALRNSNCCLSLHKQIPWGQEKRHKTLKHTKHYLDYKIVQESEMFPQLKDSGQMLHVSVRRDGFPTKNSNYFPVILTYKVLNSSKRECKIAFCYPKSTEQIPISFTFMDQDSKKAKTVSLLKKISKCRALQS